ncbi:UNVERIFIED_CONTAM: hypothetical protein HDU68_009796 [Siphonaria sp. JEL0065]|nr:hypothetical protein HDU68_009796 [Siphonaria sp. JEL0065]
MSSANIKHDPLSVSASRPTMGQGFATNQIPSKPGSQNASRSILALTKAASSQLIDPSTSLSLNPITTSRNNSLPKLRSPSQQQQQGEQQQQQNISSHNHHQQQPPSLQLHMAAANTISLPFSGNMTSFPPSEATHAIIQSTWGLFAAMGDTQRNQLLKGLLSKCSTKQVDLICTCLNLKMAEPTLPGHAPTVFATDAVGKFSPQGRVLTGRKSSTRAPLRPQQKSQSRLVDPHSIGALQSTSTLTTHQQQHGPNTLFNEIYISPTPTQNKDPRPPSLPPSTQPQNPLLQSQQQQQNSYMTPNLYIKLLNTSYNPKTLMKQIASTTSLEKTRQLFEFVITRTEKQQLLLSCMQSLSVEPPHGTVESLQTVPPGERLLKCALEVCGAREGTLYKVDQATGELSVVASTWAAREGVLEFEPGTPGLGERILGADHLLGKGEAVNVFNVKESEVYTDECHEYYGVRGRCEVECVLSLPVLVGGVKLVGAIEVINKVGWNAGAGSVGGGGGMAASAGAQGGRGNNAAQNAGKERVSPYFNAEDEYMLKCLGSIWTILLSGSGGGGGLGSSGAGGPGTPGKKKDDIKMLMNTASFMSSDLDLNGLVRVVMQTAQELLSAERCAVFMVDHKKKELWSSVAEGAGEIRIPMNKGIAGYVATSGEILNIPNGIKAL